ncbi:flagellar hook-basal body complex protein [Metabacillus sediminilitoris]|uniref:Flagellar hook protein FlgE n=1 Tax=Metabacillus sediminilitoris TaxID=2567941 RepID=A0A4S4C5A1_9BACI|nr:flagellar hook-basal body complex protein [Metabacillus sediminilitoris]QGQ46851.1 flagellar hook-basal body complex protein [Metabacillus sediminilitoris]THF82999.1 flagellar hook-basal body complex protein [Metabacillus sediminilitoris]
MLRSLYSGISGMKNFQTKLDVIGNNIANVNTYGFKKSRVTFSDLVSQQIAGAAGATQTSAGTNPQQIGLGAQISSIDTIHSAGATQTTSRTLDLALSGDGFFPVGTITDLSRVNIDQGNQIGNNRIIGAIDGAVDMNYTRAGNLYLDDKGYLVTADGMYVIGEAGEKTVPSDQAIQKSQDGLNAINNFSTPYGNMMTSLEDISKQANELMNAYQEYNDAVNNYTENETGTTGPLYNAMVSARSALNTIIGQYNTTQTSFNTDATGFRTSVTNLTGDIASFNAAQPVGTIVKEVNTTINQLTGTFQNVTGNTEVTDAVLSTLNDKISTLNNYMIDLEKIGQSVMNFEGLAEDLQKPQFSNKLSGEAGLIQIPLDAQSFSIGSDGTVTFVNAKGELNIAGQVRVATFSNSSGLEKVGGNLFKQSANSGSIDKNNNGIQLDELSVAGEDGVASIVAGALEMSNVDLSEEFTEMIVAQRAFQSNTKIITTSDEILQELMGLKR